MSVPAAKVYQFKIALKRSKPPVWRRIQVPADWNFFQLHLAIQSVMGWSDTHLHMYEINQSSSHPTTIGLPHQLTGIPGLVDENTAKLAEFFKPENNVTYTYDLGDTWDHSIVLEKELPSNPRMKYPRCVAGRRRTPIEHPTEEELEWEMEMRYDPDEHKFNPKSIVFKV